MSSVDLCSMGAHGQCVSHKLYAEKVAPDIGLNPGMASSACVIQRRISFHPLKGITSVTRLNVLIVLRSITYLQ